MKVDVIDTKGKKVEALELSDNVFGAKPNSALISQYVHVYRSNQRQGTSSAKTRAEVSGGGKKPWRQKGTGRARHGSIRSPIWRTGGVAHGPKPKNWNLNLPKKVRRLALTISLSKKAADKNLIVLKDLKIKEPKTSEMSKILEDLKIEPRNTLLILEENDMNIRKSANNVKGLSTALADNVNAYQILSAGKVIFLKNAILKVQDRYETK